ncbi:MarR family winged helix-turn-helix transcriptional regulator [Cellulomonas shaoxiangyii]|uniref:MarR family transcriptional regulator n=1 Tax=Cellulomonas shaoxiangyii TaxID=2566013 RepID=A0A4P7SIL4_9CELL|nr:MarR family winged helix-turn-helix transcriptional regulator [Cellulomonas shaoxiangyii]QCB93377.1 MarR family transcriptional regulator [Cellulomonas shaoxiangyii]TGY85339.1 MarR family transcriptional regulator [Cellulomonas shaoxiangyii]
MTDVTEQDRVDDHWPVGRLLSAAARRIEREWNTHLAAWDLNHASHPVLVHLTAGPMSQRGLAEACGVTEQTMSRVLARLERTGYVSRRPDTTDRRRHVIAITDAGRQAFLASADPRPAQERVFAALDERQQEQLRQLLLLVVQPEDPEAWTPRTVPEAPEGTPGTGRRTA